VLLVAPREGGDALAEPSLCPTVHHLRPFKRRREEARIDERGADIGGQPLPERSGLACGLSTRRMRTASRVQNLMTCRSVNQRGAIALGGKNSTWTTSSWFLGGVSV
jgi:hypothetical protein